MILRKEIWIILIIYFVLKTSTLALSTDQTAEALACSRNPDLPYCRIFGTKISTRNRRDDQEKDAIACRELRTEYINSCTRDKIATKDDEFCNAYENVCFRIPSGEPDQPIVKKITEVENEREITTTPKPSPPKKDYTEFCKEYKQRFLYVCPDPFRFGQRAAVFCPIYSERCNIPVPEKPVPPTQRPPVNALGEALSNRRKVCEQYRGFAYAYCNNPFALQRPDVRDGCSKYSRWCTRSGRR